MSGRGPPRIEGMTSLKVDNLTYRTTCEDLRRVFEKYGDVGDVYIPKDRFSRESRGFAFVRWVFRFKSLLTYLTVQFFPLDFMIDVMLKMRCTLWMEEWWMDENCECSLPDMDAQMTHPADHHVQAGTMAVVLEGESKSSNLVEFPKCMCSCLK